MNTRHRKVYAEATLLYQMLQKPFQELNRKDHRPDISQKKLLESALLPFIIQYEQKNDTEYLHKKSIYRILKEKEIFTRRGNNAGI